jgi:hypothetical protein
MVIKRSAAKEWSLKSSILFGEADGKPCMSLFTGGIPFRSGRRNIKLIIYLIADSEYRKKADKEV